MKLFTKQQKIAGQSNQSLRKPQKHDANLRKNSGLYFQIGLVLCLLATYGLFEMKFEVLTNPIIIHDPWDDETVELIQDIEIYQEPVAMVKPEPRAKVLSVVEPIIQDHIPEAVETPVVTAPKIDVPLVKVKVAPKKTPVEPDDRPRNMGELEVVPIYPGCEKETTNDDRVKCMSRKLSRLIQNRFDTDIAYRNGLTGEQRISVQFKIDKNGHVTDIKTRAPHKVLEEEALRLADRIPDMQPGKQSSKPVSVLSNLPIRFMVND